MRIFADAFKEILNYMNDICCIGHITLDKIVTPKQTTYMPGGTSYYFSHGIRRLKDFKNYKLVTAVAPSEYGIIEEMRRASGRSPAKPSHRIFRKYIRRESGQPFPACIG
jgi:hypothetical protein